MKTIIAMTGLLMMTCATATTSKLNTSYEDWDTNKDGGLQRNEFVDGYTDSNYFHVWSNRGSSISYNEFLTHAFNFLDRNRNGKIERVEFDGQINGFYFGTQQNILKQWDKNSNDQIENEEFIEQCKISQLASLWDNDGDKSISEREMASGMYDLCNTNNDSKIDQQEFDQWRAKRNTDVSSPQVTTLHQ
jgi:Ca2+-binding EF-hand superfamily protein